MVLAVPSWVVPGTYAENLAFLAERSAVQAVELLFFLYDDETEALLRRELAAIRDYRGRFRFTAHLPDRLGPEHEVLLELLAPLAASFVVHPPEPAAAESFAGMFEVWEGRYGNGRSAAEDRFLLENTQGGRLEALRPFLPGMGLCMDTGHLLLEGRSPAAYFREFKSLIGEIHLHALDAPAAERDGRLPDHRALSGREDWLAELAGELWSFEGVVDLEVFSWAEAEASLSALAMQGLIALPARAAIAPTSDLAGGCP